MSAQPKSIFHCAVLLATICSIASAVFAQEKPAAGAAAPAAVAAVVNDTPVYVAEVNNALAALVKNNQVNPRGIGNSKAEVLRSIINRRLAQKLLMKDETYIKKAEVDRALARLKAQLDSQKLTIEQYVEKAGVSPETVRLEIAWKLAWDRYVERHLTEGLEDYFKAHHKDFDGTEVRASHILLRPRSVAEPVSQLIAQADQIRDDIEAGKITFEDAVAKYSVGPSRKQNGDLGFFPRIGVMAEGFAKAAFGLDKGEIGEPVATNFGVHLIKVTDVKPGNKQWTETIEQLRGPASLDLFEKLAADEREKATITYTGAVPYFKTGTNELVMPGNAKK